MKIHANRPGRFTVLRSYTVHALLLVFFFILAIYPLLSLLHGMTAQIAVDFLSGPIFFPALRNSVVSALAVTLISVTLAYALAYCTERVQVKHRALLCSLFVLPMLIPSIAHGMGAVLLFGNSGILTGLFHLKGSIYGLSGVVLALVMYTLPTAYIMLTSILRYQDATPYEVAAVLNIPAWEQFRNITFPYLVKPLISVCFTVFTLAFTDYGVPLMVGGKFMTLPVLLYQEVIGQLNFEKGVLCSLALLLPAVVAFLIDLHNHSYAQSAFITVPFSSRHTPGVRTGASLFCWAAGLCILMPIAAFLPISFATSYPSHLAFSLEHFLQTLRIGASGYLFNSLIMSAGAALLGVITATAAAYLAARMPSGVSRLIHLLSLAAVTIPGIVLGLAYALAFRGSLFYGTLVILILVNTVHFFSSPYLMIYQSFLKINQNLEPVGAVLSVSRFRMIKDVLLPMCRSTLLDMFSYFFINCMVTISAVSFLVNASTTPLALLIDQFEIQRQLECAAVVSLIILVVNFMVKLIIQRLKSRN